MQLRDIAYYKTGGSCLALHAPTSIAELATIMQSISNRACPYFVLGGGSNSLVLDEPYDGEVISCHRLLRLECQGQTIIAGAGIENSTLTRLALRHSLAGAAWMHRLPGQIGGTVRMNARCYGGEISQIVTKVTTVTAQGEIKTYSGGHIFRGYKDTIFMDNGDLVAEVEIKLTPGEPNVISQQMQFCEQDRTKKGQFDFPSCGCVFKNDYKVGVSSGLLLDHAGAKSLSVGGAHVSPHHANFVYNKGASSRDILLLSFAMRELVYDKFGVWMDYEMEVLGDLPADLKSKLQEKRAPHWDENALAKLRQLQR